MMSLETFFDGIFSFTLYYPLFMAYLWMSGAMLYYMHWERKKNPVFTMPDIALPHVSILAPCHNEGDNIIETIEYLLDQQYPHVEIIAINDASTDNTGDLLDTLSQQHANLRVIHLEQNMGKAAAMNLGALASNSEYLVCIDGDALLDEHAISHMIQHFINGPRVGAVTGNPRIRTRSTLLGKIQVGEFSAIIGLIKRAQRTYGRVFTVSGVVSMFRKSALHRVGYWSTDMITDDIDISWKLQLDHWDIRYEPKALCWILMPETYTGLFRQRIRWAQGGIEVLVKFFKHLGIWKSRRMWMVYVEFLLSVFWSFSIFTTFTLWVLGYFIELPEPLQVASLLPSWGGVLLGVTCLAQFALSLIIDANYEKGLWRYYYWMVWFPIIYWIVNVISILIGLPKALMRKKGKNATWVSPDRGLREE